MFCANCGSNIPEGIKFCPNCGSAVAQPTADIPAAPVFTPPAAPEIPEPPVFTEEAPAVSEPVQPDFQQPVQQFAEMEEKLTQQAEPVIPQYEQPAQPYIPQPPQYVPPIQQPVEQPAHAKEKKSSKKGLIIGIIAGVVVLAAIAAVLFLFVFNKSGGYSNYEELIDEYFDSLEDKDYAGAAKLYPKSMVSGDAKTFLDDWDSHLDSYGTDFDSTEVYEVKEYDDDAVKNLEDIFGGKVTQYVDVTVKATTDGGKEETFDFDLMIFNDAWYLVEVW